MFLLFHNVPVQVNVANVLQDQGKPEEALAMFNEALVVLEKDLGLGHPLVADTKIK